MDYYLAGYQPKYNLIVSSRLLLGWKHTCVACMYFSNYQVLTWTLYVNDSSVRPPDCLSTPQLTNGLMHGLDILNLSSLFQKEGLVRKQILLLYANAYNFHPAVLWINQLNTGILFTTVYYWVPLSQLNCMFQLVTVTL